MKKDIGDRDIGGDIMTLVCILVLWNKVGLPYLLFVGFFLMGIIINLIIIFAEERINARD